MNSVFDLVSNFRILVIFCITFFKMSGSNVFLLFNQIVVHCCLLVFIFLLFI